LPGNTLNFSIPAVLSLTGTYYLSIFPGFSGVTNRQIYLINPAYIGQVISRSPNPIASASLKLI
jgi:hypothetical protein